MVNFLNLPTVEAPRNALMNFTPINNALSENRNALMQQQQLDMRKEEQTYQRGRDAKQDDAAKVKQLGDMASAYDRLTDPAQRQAGLSRILAQHPNASALGPEYRDPAQAFKLIAAEAGKWRDPREDEATNLDLQYKRAQIGKLNREDEGKVVEVNGRLVRVSPRGAEEIYASPNADSTSRAKGAPSGYLWKDPNNPAAGVEPLPGFDRPIPGDVAGKVAMMNMARDRIAKTRATLEGNWGVAGTLKNAAANVPLVGDLAWASGDIGVAQRDVRTGIEAALRTMTGAAAPEQEVHRYMQMYAPGINDTRETAKQKIDGLMKFMEDADRLVMQGRGTTPTDPPAAGGAGGAVDLKAKYGLE